MLASCRHILNKISAFHLGGFPVPNRLASSGRTFLVLDTYDSSHNERVTGVKQGRDNHVSLLLGSSDECGRSGQEDRHVSILTSGSKPLSSANTGRRAEGRPQLSELLGIPRYARWKIQQSWTYLSTAPTKSGRPFLEAFRTLRSHNNQQGPTVLHMRKHDHWCS